MNQEIISYDWQSMDFLHHKVADDILTSKFKIDCIIGILRGGLVSAIHLAYLLNVKQVGTIYIQTMSSENTLSEKLHNPIVRVNLSKKIINTKNILLVDSVVASGSTLFYAISEINKLKPEKIRTCAIIDWPDSPYHFTGLRPCLDFVGTTVSRWPDFPWEH